MDNSTQDTLNLIKTSMNNPQAVDVMGKAWTQATGLVQYDLQPVARTLYPVITPLRNMIARVPAAGGTATHWKSITGINTGSTNPFVSEGNRGGQISTTVVDNVATYAGLGLEDSVTFEADYAAEGFDDARARAVEGLLRSLMIQEELAIIGSNHSLVLGTPATPTLAAVTGANSLPTATYAVRVVGLTYSGYAGASLAGGVTTTTARVSSGPYANTDTVGGYSSNKSAAATQAVDGTQTISASTTAISGAFGYAWYVGLAGAETLNKITAAPSVVITSVSLGGAQAVSAITADTSRNTLGYDGIISQILTPGSGSYVNYLAGTLTGDGAGGVVEINNAFQSFWDNYKLAPDLILVGGQELKTITKLIIAGGAAPLFRFNMDNGGGTISGGAVVGSYLNPFSMGGGAIAKVMLHPNVPAGTIIFYSTTIPYQFSNVQNVMQMKMRRDYYQLEWPLITRKYEYGIYCDGVLQNYFPPAFGLIGGILPS